MQNVWTLLSGLTGMMQRTLASERNAWIWMWNIVVVVAAAVVVVEVDSPTPIGHSSVLSDLKTSPGLV